MTSRVKLAAIFTAVAVGGGGAVAGTQLGAPETANDNKPAVTNPDNGQAINPSEKPAVTNPDNNEKPVVTTPRAGKNKNPGTKPVVANSDKGKNKSSSKNPVKKNKNKAAKKTFLPKYSGKNFYVALGAFESGNNYQRVNTIGCAGRWQFCPTWMGGPGWGKYNGNLIGWITHPRYQDERMKAYTSAHWNSLVRSGLSQNLCKTRTSAHGVRYRITQGGMLAGAHLGGVGGVTNLLRGRGDSHDVYGTYISDYVARFQNTYITDSWRAKRGNSLAGCNAHYKAQKPRPKIKFLFNWAAKQVGKKNRPWKANQRLKFINDGMRAVHMKPLKKDNPAATWRAYKKAKRAHQWGTGARKGDLVFWDSNRSGLSRKGHVGIYAGNGWVISNLNGTIKKTRIKNATPKHRMPSGFVHPNGLK